MQIEQPICPITGLSAKYYTDNGMYISYSINYQEKDVKVNLYVDAPKIEGFIQKKHIIAGLLLNGKINQEDLIEWDVPDKIRDEYEKNITGGYVELKKLLDTGYYPRTVQEKLDNLLISLYKMQEYDGQNIVNIGKLNFRIPEEFYFKTVEEYIFYLNTLGKLDLIELELIDPEFDQESFKDFFNTGHGLQKICLTHNGLAHIAEIQTEGTNSKNCFIAMAFNDKTKKIRDTIVEAVREAGYQPIIVDEEHLDSDQTIVDGIIANIKKAKFCIADFNFHRNGVYFEAGYAVGLGKPVIYTCSETEFKEAHFDIKQLQQIIYSDTDELKKALVNKIAAWID